MLGNSPCLTSDYVCLTDIIQKRCFTVVNVTHYGNDWSARQQICLIIHFIICGLNLRLSIYEFYFKSKIIRYKLNGFGIQTLVDRNHNTQHETGRNYLSYVDVHHGCQFVSGKELGYFKDFAFLFFTKVGFATIVGTYFFVTGFDLLLHATRFTGISHLTHGVPHFLLHGFLGDFCFWSRSVWVYWGCTRRNLHSLLHRYFFSAGLFAFAFAFFA